MFDSRPFDRLTERQMQVLRLVFQHRTSKEIALSLEISKSAVDQLIDRAVRILEARDRRDAARLLAEHESSSDHVPYDPIRVVEPSSFTSDLPPQSVEDAVLLRDIGTTIGRAHHAPLRPPPGPRWRLPIGTREDDHEDLTTTERLLWPVGIAIALLALIVLAAAASDILARVARAHF